MSRCGTAADAGTRKLCLEAAHKRKKRWPCFPRKDRAEEAGPDPLPNAILAPSIWTPNLNHTVETLVCYSNVPIGTGQAQLLPKVEDEDRTNRRLRLYRCHRHALRRDG